MPVLQYSPSDKEQKRFENKQNKINKQRKQNKKPTLPVRKKTWKDNSCKGMLIKPSIEALKENAVDLQDRANNMINDIEKALLDKGVDITAQASKDFAVRTGVKHTAALGCGVFAGIGAVVCEAIAAVTTIVDGVYTTIDTGIDLYQNSKKLLQNIDTLKQQISNSKELLEMLSDKSLTADQLTEKKQKIVKDMQDSMEKAVENDKCLAARKCMLVPYKNKQGDLASGEQKKGEGKKDGPKKSSVSNFFYTGVFCNKTTAC